MKKKKKKHAYFPVFLINQKVGAIIPKTSSSEDNILLEPLYPTPFPLFYTYLNTKNTYEAIKVDDLTCFIK